MRAIYLTEAACREWGRAEHLAEGKDGIRARTIRRGKAILARAHQPCVRVYAHRSNVVLLTIYRGDSHTAGCPVPQSLRGEA